MESIIHKITKEEIDCRLSELEADYGMSTEEFLELYKTGIPPEMDLDAFDWKVCADWDKELD